MKLMELLLAGGCDLITLQFSQSSQNQLLWPYSHSYNRAQLGDEILEILSKVNL